VKEEKNSLAASASLVFSAVFGVRFAFEDSEAVAAASAGTAGLADSGHAAVAFADIIDAGLGREADLALFECVDLDVGERVANDA
jgi:hypothetical protein